MLAVDSRTEQTWALKIMKLEGNSNDSEVRRIFKNEVTILSSLDHPNIIKILSFSKTVKVIDPDLAPYNAWWIGLEYAAYGDMFKYLSKLGRFEEPIARYYFHQLISSIEYTHNCGYSHRDLKIENWLLDKDFHLKLADFGFSSKSKTSRAYKGTRSYMAPEIYERRGYSTEAADVFSAGVVLFVMCTWFTPFLKAHKSDQYYSKVIEDKWDELWEQYYEMDNFITPFSPGFKDLISKLLTPNPRKRLTIQKIKQHEWFKGKVASEAEIFEEMTKRWNNILLNQSTEHHSTDDDSHKGSESLIKYNNSSQFKWFDLIWHKSSQIRFSQFYQVKDGDELLRPIEQYVIEKDFIYIKSSNELKLDIIIKTDSEITNLTFKILFHQDNHMRWVQFIKLWGSSMTFDEIWSEVSTILDSCFGVLDHTSY